MSAVMLATAAVILIFVQFRWAGRADTEAIYTPHRAVGMTAVAAMLVQGLLGAFRPHLGNQRRSMWKRVHQVWGAITIALGELHQTGIRGAKCCCQEPPRLRSQSRVEGSVIANRL